MEDGTGRGDAEAVDGPGRRAAGGRGRISGAVRLAGGLGLLAVAGVLFSAAATVLLPRLLLETPVPTGWRGTGPDTALTVFAHRGGVREGGAPDNSIAALEAAIARGYGGVEVDVLEARDGVLIAHHDPGFERFYAPACRANGFHVCEGGKYGKCGTEARQKGLRRCHVEEMTGAEIADLRNPETGHRVTTLEEFLEVAGTAGLQVMLDFKNRVSPRAVREVERLLDAHLADRPVYFIGRTPPKLTLVRRRREAHFGVVRLAHPLAKVLLGLGARGEPFLFQRATMTGREDLVYASVLGMEIIPSVNRAHLRSGASDDPGFLVDLAHREIERLHALGVRKFQIDSEFDGLFFERRAER